MLNEGSGLELSLMLMTGSALGPALLQAGCSTLPGISLFICYLLPYV